MEPRRAGPRLPLRQRGPARATRRTGFERLVERSGAYNTIRYSPDGSLIAFTTFDGLWVMERDGANLRRLGTNEAQVIALAERSVRSLRAPGGIHVVDLDNRTACSSPAGHSPQWSSKNRIAYV